MIWFLAPAILAVLGLFGPALLCLALVGAVRLACNLGICATAYITIFLMVGLLAG